MNANDILTQDMGDTGKVDLRVQLVGDLRYYLPAEEYVGMAKAPLSWLIEFYADDVIKYGGNLNVMKDLFGTLRTKTYAELKALEEACWVNWEESLTDQRFDALTELLGKFSYKRPDLFMYAHGLDVAMRSNGTYLLHLLRVLQIRHWITPSTRYTLEDYNIFTKPFREFGINVHPDDDLIFGMKDYVDNTELVY